ncbi:MAG: hypothetical protein GY851_27755 [bacterium]|nr:hypothetical protein [bacterium]
MKLGLMTVLDDGEIRQIHDATLHILEHTGVKIGSTAILDLLEQKGLPIDRDAGVARFPRAVMEDALATVPSQFEVHDREGEPAFVLGDGAPRIAAGHNAVFWVDSETGETRPSTVADVELFAGMCEELPAIDMIGIPVMPQDVDDPRTTLIHGVRACVESSRKPIFFSTDRPEINRAIIDLLRAAFAGDLGDQVYGISQLSPTSPLFWEGSVLDALAETVRLGVPVAVLPEPNAGVSAPYTLAGLLTVNNAECLSGIVLTQLIRPGAKVMYANSWTTTDMRRGYALVGSVETSVCRIAGAQLARFYGIPSHTTAPNSDNHAHDEQNAWEKALSLVCSAGAGNDLIVNCGMFATGMTCSHEQLLMDEEMAAMTRRIVAGVNVSDDTIAQDLIEEIGPHGTGYLTAMHTLDRLQGDEFITPRLAVRGPRALWAADGEKDTYALAQDEVRRFAASGPSAPLDDGRRAQVAEIVESFTFSEEIQS